MLMTECSIINIEENKIELVQLIQNILTLLHFKILPIDFVASKFNKYQLLEKLIEIDLIMITENKEYNVNDQQLQQKGLNSLRYCSINIISICCSKI